MNTDYILQADVLDIVFNKRNKNYGAYTLRKFYNNRLFKSLGITMSVAIVLSAFTFMPKGKGNGNIFISDSTTLVALPVTEPMKPEPKKPEPKKEIKEPVKIQPVKTQNFVNKIVITKDPLDATKLAKDLDDVAIGNQTTDHPDGSSKQLIIPVDKKGGGGNGLDSSAVPAFNPETPLPVAEIMPSYPGGIPALRKFLEKNLQNPQDLEDGQTVSVKVKFIVGYDGVLKGFEIAEDGGKVFNNEVIRVLKKMPQWIPGKSKGQNVSVYYMIPVKFTPLQ